VVGGAVLWFVSAEGTEALLEPVTDVALVAGRTLEAAIGMARGCGVDVDVDPVLPLEQLSSRELQVARLAAAGLTDVNIAESLVISEQTVGAHMRRIFLKLRINSRLQLVQDTRLRRSLAS
jgi:DNA-binding NarL/FixJ family response regulator